MIRIKIAGTFLAVSIIAFSVSSHFSRENIRDVAEAGMSLIISPAHAVVGRPLTPVSYAGVARRTARRTARRY
jgi:hypothetical protein